MFVRDCIFGHKSLFFLALGEPLLKRLRKNTIGALNRVLGFFILAIAVQLIADGVFALLKDAAPNLLH
jgi:multiple antibiotic resistance protein